MVYTLFLALIIVTLAVGLWSLLFLNRAPRRAFQGYKARITGSCGDTMEIVLNFHDGRVYNGSYWTDGCPYSFMCLFSAVQLAKGKKPEDILDMDYKTIAKSVGDLPNDHLHCATLAIQTLHGAVDNYMRL